MKHTTNLVLCSGAGRAFPNPRPFALGVPFYMSSFAFNLTTGRWMWGGESIVLP